MGVMKGVDIQGRKQEFPLRSQGDDQFHEVDARTRSR